MKIAADDILKHFFLVIQEIGFELSCSLSQMETICMNFMQIDPYGGDNLHEISKPVFWEK